MYLLLKDFIKYAENQQIIGKAFIVGGAVRDILALKETKDIDIAVKGSVMDIARRFAARIGASFVPLDTEFGIARIVKNSEFLDICAMRGDSIYADLADRDITINAMALPLTEIFNHQSIKNKIIDPHGGMYDLSHRIIRMTSEENLIKDPLRLLRIYRFAATLNFQIEEHTHNAVKRLAPLITSSAVERIAEELRHIINEADSYKTIELMMNDNILMRILPEISISKLYLYKNTEWLINESQYLMDNYKKICLKLSALFEEPSSAKKAAMRLKMSKKETEFIYSMVSNRSRILILRENVKDTPDAKEIIQLIKKFKDDIYALAIVGMAVDPSAVQFWRNVIAFYHEKIKPRLRLLPLITGYDLIERFNLNPSPLFKKILDSIEDAVLNGTITSKDEAIQAAEKMIKS